jgi:hypothetical protein
MDLKLKSPPRGRLAGLTALVKQVGENLSNTVYYKIFLDNIGLATNNSNLINK